MNLYGSLCLTKNPKTTKSMHRRNRSPVAIELKLNLVYIDSLLCWNDNMHIRTQKKNSTKETGREREKSATNKQYKRIGYKNQTDT